MTRFPSRINTWMEKHMNEKLIDLDELYADVKQMAITPDFKERKEKGNKDAGRNKKENSKKNAGNEGGRTRPN